MTFDSDILIAGGGLNGPALALALAQAGFDVTVVDARPAPERAGSNFDGRGYALALASQRLLEGLGGWGQGAGRSAIHQWHVRGGGVGGPARAPAGARWHGKGGSSGGRATGRFCAEKAGLVGVGGRKGPGCRCPPSPRRKTEENGGRPIPLGEKRR